jgi:hypothetical protein
MAVISTTAAGKQSAARASSSPRGSATALACAQLVERARLPGVEMAATTIGRSSTVAPVRITTRSLAASAPRIAQRLAVQASARSEPTATPSTSCGDSTAAGAAVTASHARPSTNAATPDRRAYHRSRLSRRRRWP